MRGAIARRSRSSRSASITVPPTLAMSAMRSAARVRSQGSSSARIPSTSSTFGTLRRSRNARHAIGPARSRARAGSARVAGSPAIRTLPSSGRRSPATQRRSVLFPDPGRPTIPTISPHPAPSVTPSSARTSIRHLPSPATKRLRRSRMSRSGAPGGVEHMREGCSRSPPSPSPEHCSWIGIHARLLWPAIEGPAGTPMRRGTRSARSARSARQRSGGQPSHDAPGMAPTIGPRRSSACCPRVSAHGIDAGPTSRS
jgi:hypothetical protein